MTCDNYCNMCEFKDPAYADGTDAHCYMFYKQPDVQQCAQFELSHHVNRMHDIIPSSSLLDDSWEAV